MEEIVTVESGTDINITNIPELLLNGLYGCFSFFLLNFPSVRSHCCSFSFLKSSVADLRSMNLDPDSGLFLNSDCGSRSRIPIQVARFLGSEFRKNLKGFEKLFFNTKTSKHSNCHPFHFVGLRKVFPSTRTRPSSPLKRTSSSYY